MAEHEDPAGTEALSVVNCRHCSRRATACKTYVAPDRPVRRSNGVETRGYGAQAAGNGVPLLTTATEKADRVGMGRSGDFCYRAGRPSLTVPGCAEALQSLDVGGENLVQTRFVEADHRIPARAKRRDAQVAGENELLAPEPKRRVGGVHFPPRQPPRAQDRANALAQLAVRTGEEYDLAERNQDRAEIAGVIRIPNYGWASATANKSALWVPFHDSVVSNASSRA